MEEGGRERESAPETERGAEAARGSPGDAGDRELDLGTCAAPSDRGRGLRRGLLGGGGWKRALLHSAGQASAKDAARQNSKRRLYKTSLTQVAGT